MIVCQMFSCEIRIYSWGGGGSLGGDAAKRKLNLTYDSLYAKRVTKIALSRRHQLDTICRLAFSDICEKGRQDAFGYQKLLWWQGRPRCGFQSRATCS